MAQNAINAGDYQLVAIGGSAGSLEAILTILASLPAPFPTPVILIIHRKNEAENLLVKLLSSKSDLPVKEAEEKEPLLANTIYIAPPDYHLLIEKDKTISLDTSERVNFSRPSIDVAFASASEVYGQTLIGIILSGANADGAEGLKIIKEKGGLAIVQNPASAASPFMPRQAINKIRNMPVYSPEEIGALLQNLPLHRP